ncbi:sigma 54-interacting transcriptional regulator [Methylomonas methanica]|uniref:Sigma-54 factor interaction domain-containing protein n=1 Tax=Methylomonas methanica TaxID=421 RepID=A0A177LRK3_METMH|nr:sigma 54-interacting transcriptional regulator [Methylomonas methanica]OAH96010.1 hypothetical protein A1353_24400 [Methylomonas methanica]OAH98830.1 hypothetical protein A1332_20135 [Methylomonas methanica]
MSDTLLPELNAISFLQMFITQSVKLAGQYNSERGTANHIQDLGLTASSYLEAHARRQLGLSGKISPEQYASIITHIKQQIGGSFTQVPSGSAGCVCVENFRCPFGERVKEAPELCRTTASVFGGIAARNFGYAKVVLNKRIATGDGKCEVTIYTDREAAPIEEGDEYLNEGGMIVSRSAIAEVAARVSEKMARTWNPKDVSGQKRVLDRPELIAESEVMREALQAVELVAPTSANVLINGETGVGKEVIARAIHALSDRNTQKFVAVNCGAIPESLLESALFGHEKGAFTGAHEHRHGFFERADGGTLFLDEIDSLPLLSQANLLRVLQEGEFERVGGAQVLHSNVRIITASNRPLLELVDQGRFRKDLYYRLNVVTIRISPLRERREDITALVNYLLKQIAHRYGKFPKVLSNEAWQQIMAYEWPGNVRELENVLERAFLFSSGQIITKVGLDVSPKASVSADQENLRGKKRLAASQVETKTLQDALVKHNGNVTAVANEIGISRRAIHQKLKHYNIDAGVFRKR